MQLTSAESALNTQIMDANQTYGFPPGYFIIRSLATNRILDVEQGWVEDGTSVILFPETETSLVDSMRNPECDNQVFFIDTSGFLCSRSAGHAIDVEEGRLVLRHRRPVIQPFPNEYSHPLPRFSYDPSTRNITATFAADPAYPRGKAATTGPWQEKVYLLTSIPARKSRTIVDDASEFITSTIASPLSFFNAFKAQDASPEAVFSSGEIDLREDEILEQDRTDEGEVDDSPDKHRQVRIVALSKEEVPLAGEKARLRRQWLVVPLRLSKNRTTSY